MNKFRLRQRTPKSRKRMTDAQRAARRIRDYHRVHSMQAPPDEAEAIRKRIDKLARQLPADGSRRRLADDLALGRAPSHNSSVIRLQSIRGGHRAIYPSQVSRWSAVLDRYRALGYDC